MKIVNCELFPSNTHAYAGSLDGYVVYAITRIPTVGIIKEKEYSEFTVEDKRPLTHVYDFNSECFHGLLKEGGKKTHQQKL